MDARELLMNLQQVRQVVAVPRILSGQDAGATADGPQPRKGQTRVAALGREPHPSPEAARGALPSAATGGSSSQCQRVTAPAAQRTFPARAVAGLALLAALFLSVPCALAQTYVSPGDPALLEAALAAGGEVIFDGDGTTTLDTPLVISTSVSLDSGGYDVTISGGAVALSSTNLNTNVFTRIVCVTNLILTNIITTNIDGFVETNRVLMPVTNCSPVLMTNITTNVVISAEGVGLFAVRPRTVLTLLNLTLAKGLRARGGAVLNEGTLVASNCDFNGNVALGTNGVAGRDGPNSGISSGGDGGPGGPGESGWGGAIYNSGTAAIWHSRFLTNVALGGNGGNGGSGGNGLWGGGDGGNGGAGATARGGALCNDGTLRLVGCSINASLARGGAGGLGGTNGAGAWLGMTGKGGPGAPASGAGLFNSGTLFLEGCTFAENEGVGGDSAKAGSTDDSALRDGHRGGDAFGGGVCNVGQSTLANCTFFLNTLQAGAGGDGGDGLPGSLFYGNGGNGGNAWGGSLFNASWTAVTNCTLSDGGVLGGTNGLAGGGNVAGHPGNPGLGLGGNLANSNGTVYIKNSILAYPAAGTNAYGSVNDLGYNLSSDWTPALTGAGSLRNTNPKLGLLADHGGPTETIAPEPNSPVINKGDPAFFLPTDQRGITRPQGGRGDMGAYEVEAACLQGRVTLGGVGLAGVTITVGDALEFADETVTDGTGRYAFTNLPYGTLTVLPTREAFEFTPPVRSVTIGPAVATADFTASGVLSIHGRVALGATGLEGVRVSSGGQSAFTDADGFYTLSDLALGSHTVTAALVGYVFLPLEKLVTLETGDANGVDFAAIQLYRVEGTVFDEITGNGKKDVVVRVFSTNGIDGFGAGVWTLTNRTDAQGHFVFTNVPAGQVEVRPSLAGFGFVGPTHFELTADRAGVDFVAFQAYTVSGRVVWNGQGMSGVTVEAGVGGGVDGSAETDLQGYYTITGLAADSYEVTPSLDGFAFTPAFTSVTVGPNRTGVNFVARPALEISGQVLKQGAGLAGVSVTVNGAVVLTDVNGFYRAQNLPPGDYTVTPYLNRHVFQPESEFVTLIADSEARDFEALPLCNINGRVTTPSNGLAGVTVTGGDKSAVTDSAGYYSLVGVVGGDTVVVTPSKTGYAFSPAERSFLLLSNVSQVNFVTVTSLALRGRILEGTNGVRNVTVVASGRTNISDTSGNYRFDLPPGDYVVAPRSAGVGFGPVSSNVTLGSVSVSNVNFSANPPRLGIGWTTNAAPLLTLLGLPERSYTIAAAANFGASSNWLTLVTNTTGTNATFEFRLTNYRAAPLRFFRPGRP